MSEDEQERQRAKRGSIEARLSLRLPADLNNLAEAVAALERISVVEWWRRAGEERIRRLYPDLAANVLFDASPPGSLADVSRQVIESATGKAKKRRR